MKEEGLDTQTCCKWFFFHGPGGVVSRYKGCGGAVAAAQVSGDGSLLAVCGLDRYLRVYRLERPTLLHQVGRE